MSLRTVTSFQTHCRLTPGIQFRPKVASRGERYWFAYPMEKIPTSVGMTRERSVIPSEEAKRPSRGISCRGQDRIVPVPANALESETFGSKPGDFPWEYIVPGVRKR